MLAKGLSGPSRQRLPGRPTFCTPGSTELTGGSPGERSPKSCNPLAEMALGFQPYFQRHRLQLTTTTPQHHNTSLSHEVSHPEPSKHSCLVSNGATEETRPGHTVVGRSTPGSDRLLLTDRDDEHLLIIRPAFLVARVASSSLYGGIG